MVRYSIGRPHDVRAAAHRVALFGDRRLGVGLEWAGVGRTIWQVEIDSFCRSVLEKHWPKVARFEDVKCVGAENLAPADVVCGGFPCQDISNAGKRAGIDGFRSGL